MKGDVSTRVSEGGEHARGKGDWFLSVRGDGTNVQYWNESAMSAGRSNAVDAARRLPQSRVQQMGAAFISDRLRDFVVLGAGEQVVPVGVQYLLENTDSEQGATPEVVTASRATYRRRVNGVDVIGAGSTVSITFDNAGTVIGFRFDWPEYAREGSRQAVLDIASIKARAGALSAAPGGGAKLDLLRMNCGYYDRGAEERDWSAPVQSACSVGYVSNLSGPRGNAQTAIEELVPAGATVRNDVAWPATARAISGGNISRDTPLGQALHMPAENPAK
jgi:hypothetical protein